MTEVNVSRELFTELTLYVEMLDSECFEAMNAGTLDTEKQPKLAALVRWWQAQNGLVRSSVRAMVADSAAGRFIAELDRLSDALNAEG